MSLVNDATVVEPHVLGLRCRECGREFPVAPVYTCEWCFGPLEVSYDYAGMHRNITRETIEAGPASIWRIRSAMTPPSVPLPSLPPMTSVFGMNGTLLFERASTAFTSAVAFAPKAATCLSYASALARPTDLTCAPWAASPCGAAAGWSAPGAGTGWGGECAGAAALGALALHEASKPERSWDFAYTGPTAWMTQRALSRPPVVATARPRRQSASPTRGRPSRRRPFGIRSP